MNGHRSVWIMGTSVDRMIEIINSFQEGKASPRTCSWQFLQEIAYVCVL